MTTTQFKPYIAPEKTITEMTVSGLVIGSILGIVFAASSVYLALKVGLTVSASIPIAVLSITIFRAFGRATILQNNMVQTVGSAGESIAAGLAFTLPSLLLMGQDLEFMRILLVGLLGGMLGVLMMIPLRQGLIVQEHGKLTYPEGTACADVLIVGDKGGTTAKTVFLGAIVGFVYGFLNLVTRFWKDTSDWTLRFFKGASISAEVSATLLGVGYIIGPKTAANMMAGGALAFIVIIPIIKVFGDGLEQIIFPATKLIRDMSPGELRNAYVLYIGAGAVATGGIISLIRSIPSIIGAFKRGVGSLSAARRGTQVIIPRTERDIPMVWVLGGSAALVLAIWASPMLQINFVSAILIVLFGFFFVTVSSRITGEIGSSSNPISGMTVATLLITCLLFLAVGWTGVDYRAMALTTAALVCVAASNGGTISQSLKTGYLVGATPSLQQTGILVGVITSAVVIGYTLLFLNESKTTFSVRNYPQFTATVEPDARKVEAYDGKTYAVVSVPEPTNGVPTGQYLVNDQGKIVYLMDPGVCGTDVEKVEPIPAGEYANFRAEALPPDAPTFPLATGPAPILELHSGRDGVPPGRYLVDAGGAITHRVVAITKFDAPKARLFSLIIDGILTRKLPWALVLIGVALAFMMELVGVSSLPFAVGLYLPISTSTPIFVGGVVRLIIDKRRKVSAAEAEFSPGVLLASGLIAGGAFAGLFQAIVQGVGADATWDKSSWLSVISGADWWALIPFAGLALLLYFVAGGSNNKEK
jgi:putative OPT family oligopeptide transporter